MSSERPWDDKEIEGLDYGSDGHLVVEGLDYGSGGNLVEHGSGGGMHRTDTVDLIVKGNNESLEGSDGDDVLIGDGGPNSLMGHLGADVLLGRGGRDFVDAVDGQRDKLISCGPGEDEVLRDSKDPRPQSC